MDVDIKNNISHHLRTGKINIEPSQFQNLPENCRRKFKRNQIIHKTCLKIVQQKQQLNFLRRYQLRNCRSYLAILAFLRIDTSAAEKHSKRSVAYLEQQTSPPWPHKEDSVQQSIHNIMSFGHQMLLTLFFTVTSH